MSKNKEIHAQTLKIPKVILITAKFLELISTKLVVKFAAKLFTTPIKHKIPKREFLMDKESFQEMIFVPSINKEIIVYHYGKSGKKILLVHGWSGRGTQLVKIADELLNLGYSTISFDAPAHGKSKGNSSIMIEFIASILELEKQFGPFEFAIGHSLGGMSILNAIRENLKINKAVIIGSGDIIQDIIDDFIEKLKLKHEIGIKLRDHFEKKYNSKMNYYSASNAAKEVSIPVLIIHDENDVDVNVKAAYQINENLKNSELMITKNLGHRKILGNTEVIMQIIKFINE
ncbi:alpha/beta hydrolase [Flavobacterium sp.]|uniref:alpha/beta fold hydrolase n=1 Tax=Flavobacterium sp. TaxID=239 RepID=UPI0026244BD1|nr:alpha/beta hydrolase [Flavobacterium sp.]